MFEILRADIPSRFGIPVLEINGETPVPERQTIVDRFSEFNGPALLVLNPRAAGTGLNITDANYVIHYNLEWNPALEDQASARAYRRGQKKTVFVYRLYYADTVEQIVNERIELKRSISELAVVGTKGTCENRDEIMAALMLSPREESK
jgi:SNF2 family DNA or RNA helicase